MTMYEELIKQLRNRRVCVQSGGDLEQDYPLMREAADAIEELLAWHNADVRELERQKSLIADARPVVRCIECKHYVFGHKFSYHCGEAMCAYDENGLPWFSNHSKRLNGEENE